MSIHISSKEELKSTLDQFDTILLDCDGVIWHGNELIPNVKETLRYFRAQGKTLLFVTNNATKSRRQYKAKFDKLGIEASPEEIFGSAYASAVYISKIINFPKDKKVYVIGEAGLEEELASEGISYVGGSDPEHNVFLPSQDFSSIKPLPDVGAVLCGFDTCINYKKLATAYRCIMDNPDCHFILTNDDSTFPAGGSFFPGSGAISAPLIFASKKTPVIVGKPHQHMMDAIIAKNHFDRSRTLMVGDRLNTDIEFGINGGMSTLLVMTGVTQPDEIAEGSGNTTIPKFIVKSLGDFAQLI